MNLVKSVLVEPLLKHGYKKNLVTEPAVVELKEKHCIGYVITTSIKGNRKKVDIPPFFHSIYDNHKLNELWEFRERNMYCIFDMHKNGQDFDYYIAAENNTNQHNTEYAEITIPARKYVKVVLLKRNHRAVSNVMMYLQAIWIEANGYKAAKGPAFILYDERFHSNYEKHGCEGGNYLGNPVAALHIPIEDK